MAAGSIVLVSKIIIPQIFALDVELMVFASQASDDSKTRFFESAKKLNFVPTVSLKLII